jgi:hypothetical protein
MKHFFLKEGLTLRTLVACVEALSLEGDRLKIDECKIFKKLSFYLFKIMNSFIIIRVIKTSFQEKV